MKDNRYKIGELITTGGNLLYPSKLVKEGTKGTIVGHLYKTFYQIQWEGVVYTKNNPYDVVDCAKNNIHPWITYIGDYLFEID